jgi:hypothetical protein
MNDVVVLGCGPAGLLAAHAVVRAGLDPTIYSIKQKSYIPGSQVLHDAIPGLMDRQYSENSILWVRMGTAENYARKVYGDPFRETNWPAYNGVTRGWSVYTMYDKLWDMYSHNVINCEVDTELVSDVLDEGGLILSTLPAPVLCKQPWVHRFRYEPFWIKPLDTPHIDKNRDVVIYNGLEHDDWYRWSILGGQASIESCVEGYLQGNNVVPGKKVIDNNCNCWDQTPHFIKVGRWAMWQHGVLLHDAYATADRALMDYRYQIGVT